MRQYKFRAWDERNKRMIYPVGIIREILIVPDETDKGDFLGLDMIPYMQLSISAYPVMQYTGLKDKNGKEIYEADIVDAQGIIRGVVDFRNGSFVVVWDEQSKMKRACDFETFEHGAMKLLEVIGNVYEGVNVK